MAKDNEIRIENVSPRLKQELKNIAKNSGITLTALLKPKLREISESFPDHLKQAPAGY